jgi:hypothetical protein
MPNNAHKIRIESIKSLSETIRRAFAHAKYLGYSGSCLEYAMLILPEDTTIIDSGKDGYEGPLSQAPTIEELFGK